ncbi:MAG: radical SAM protein [bacterium]
MRLLLINPKFPESFWSFKWAIENILPNKRTVNPPLGLATLAALCPEEWQVEIIDENIESIPLQPEADIIGICGMGVQYQRQVELLAFFKNKGYFVVAGGSYASLCPEKYDKLADVVIAGEAEYIWKEFCRDFELNQVKKLYQETGTVDLSDSPVPRFDLLKLHNYKAVSLQYSRGCPFRCEFCDIIVMFGRRPRTKSLAQVGQELDLLRKLNVKTSFFVDDNLIGDKPRAKNLMRFLRDYQTNHHYRFRFGTEVSLNLAQDDELLSLFRQANFAWVFVGIESTDEESLKETKKFQNTRQDILSSVRKIYTHGIEILAGFIVGFDNDTTETFEKQYQFVTRSGIQSAMIGLLTALPKTPLYERLKKEGRLIEDTNESDNTKLGTNFIPQKMKYEELVNGYQQLHFRLLNQRNIANRIKNKIRYIKNPVLSSGDKLSVQLKILRNFLVKGLLPGGFPRWFHFVRTIPFTSPRLIPLVIQDWIVGLAMRDYVDRHFVQEFEKVNHLAHNYLKIIESTFQRYVKHGALEVSFSQVKNKAADLSFSLKGWLDREFFVRVTRHIEQVLEDTASSITLHIDELHETQLKHLNRLLKKLSQHGDRIYIRVHEKVRHIVEIDSSVFNLVLEV